MDPRVSAGPRTGEGRGLVVVVVVHVCVCVVISSNIKSSLSLSPGCQPPRRLRIAHRLGIDPSVTSSAASGNLVNLGIKVSAAASEDLAERCMECSPGTSSPFSSRSRPMPVSPC